MSIESRLKDVEESLRLLRDANRIQGRHMSATAPSDKQVVMWNAADKKWEPVTGAQALFARATSNLTLTTSAQSITGDGDSSKVRLILPTIGDWMIEAIFDFAVETGAGTTSIGELFVNDSGTPESGQATHTAFTTNQIATVAQRWKVTTTSDDTPVELKARKTVDVGVVLAASTHTTFVASIGIGGGSGGASVHGLLTGVTSSQHHIKYTDTEAVDAVQDEATLNLAGLIKLILNDTTIRTDAEYIRAEALSGRVAFDLRNSLLINLDVNSNDTSAALKIRHNASTTDMIRLNEDGSIDTDTINEITSGVGVTIDGALIKDGQIADGVVHNRYTNTEAVTAVPYRFYLSFGSDPLFGDTFAP